MSQNGQQKKPTLFLSYGQRDAAALAQRLRDDLARDYHVWQDKERIRVGWGWTDEIREGIKDSDILLALLSPHAVRRVGMPGNPDDKDSVCLDEIAYAVDSCRIPVVPVMALTCEPPLRIFRVQYLDFRSWEESGNYDLLLGQLRKTIEEVAASRRSRTREWDWLPEPRDFGAFLAEKRKDFTGREWLFRAVEEWRAKGGGPSLLITGDPGAGKSAIVAELVHANPGGQVLAYHCCQADTSDTLDPARFVRSLAGMLAARLEGYAAMLEHRPLREALEVADAKEAANAFEAGILNPLGDLPAPEGGTRYLLIDALDEAATRTEGPTIIDLLATRLQRFPPWLKLVATTRNEMLGRLKILQPQTVSADAPENQDDVRRYVERRLAEPGLRAQVEAYAVKSGGAAAFGQKAGALREMLLKVSQGNFLFVTKALEAINAGMLTFAQVEALPPGLGGLYQEFFDRLYARAGLDFAPTLSVLQAIVAAQEPPTREELAAVTGLDEETELPRLMSRLASFVPSRNKRYVLFHKSLRDWLTGWDEETDQPVTQDYYVSARRGHERWAALYWARYEKGARPFDARVLRHLPTHLAGARRWDDLARVLLDRRFLEAKVEGPGTNAFDLSGDFALAAEKMPEEHPRRRIVALLGEIVRFDVQFIARHPSTLFQCCWNRGFWHDSPRAASFFTVADGGAKGAPPWKQPGEKLHEFVERWRAEKEQETPGFVWVRALRPFPEILGSAQRAMIHGHDEEVGGVNSVDLSPDGLRLVSTSHGHSTYIRLWDARSGVELGVKVIEGDYMGLCGIRYMPQGDVIVAARERGDLLFLNAETLEEIDCVATGSDSLKSLSLSPDGSLLAVGAWHGLVRLWDTKGRRELCTVEAHNESAEVLAFSPDGALLASSGNSWLDDEGNYVGGKHHVKLWEVGAGLKLLAKYECADSVGSVTFTPDGGTLVWCDWAGNIEFRALEGGDAWSLSKEYGFGVLLFLRDGERFLCGSGNGFEDAPIALWNMKTRRVERSFTGHSYAIGGMALFPDGEAFVSAGDSTLRVWDLARAAEGPEPQSAEPSIDHLLFMPGGSRAVTASEKDEVAWVRALSGDAPAMRLGGHAGGVHGVASSDDGSLLACGTGEGAVRVWDAATGRELLSYQKHTSSVHGLSFSPDGRRLASCSKDGTVVLYDLKAEGEEGVVFVSRDNKDVVLLAVSPDGRRLAFGSRVSIEVWNVGEEEHQKELVIVQDEIEEPDITRLYNLFFAICFTPDGKFFIVESNLEPLTAFDVETHEQHEATDEQRAAFDRSANRLTKGWLTENEAEPRIGKDVRLLQSQGMVTLACAETGETLGWLPLKCDYFQPHPSERIWANQQAHRVCIFSVEGAV